MTTRRLPCLFRIGSTLALVLVLAGCSKGGQFDPTELFNSDTFDSKKKLTGDRQPIFPDGVPGTTAGVPPDLVKGYQPPPEQADASAAPAPEAQKPKPKLASKPKPKPKLAAAPPPPSQPPQGQDSVWNQTPATAATAAPTRISVGPKPIAPGQQADPSQSIWPGPPQTAPAQQTAQPSQSIWPDPPAPGKSSQ